MRCSTLRRSLPALFLSFTLCGCGGAELSEETAAEDEALAAASGTGCAGTWEDAQHYGGLIGTYTQPLPYVGDITRLQVFSAVDTDSVRTGGQHARAVWGLARAGRYEALESNPAIGATLSFWEPGRSEADIYFVTGLRRAAGRVTALCLIGTRAGTRPFTLRRAL